MIHCTLVNATSFFYEIQIFRVNMTLQICVFSCKLRSKRGIFNVKEFNHLEGNNYSQ